uniref:Uncharacterized protein n=1 Tax=Anguilla anguilla TaxID=7936 RepID=A0A0E9QHI5_ANGAN
MHGILFTVKFHRPVNDISTFLLSFSKTFQDGNIFKNCGTLPIVILEKT